MARCLLLKPVALACLCAAGSANAFYAGASPPSSWAQQAAGNVVKVSAGDVSFANGIRSKIAASVNVGGRVVSLPVAYRFGPTAARVAATAAFLNPGVLGALAVGSAAYAAYDWYKDSGYEIENGVWKKRVTFMQEGTEYGINGVWAASPSGPCEAYKTVRNPPEAGYVYTSYPIIISAGNVVCHMDGTRLSDGAKILNNNYQMSIRTAQVEGSRLDPVTQIEFEDGMATKPIPEGVPQKMPIPIWWPVEDPILNPSPAPSPAVSPAPVPTPQPLRVPQGEPTPVPNSDPQTWKTPVVDIVPSPVPGDPWRVDVQPKDIVKTDSSPVTQPTPDTPSPSGETEAEKTPLLCEVFPDILACAKPDLDTPQEDDLEQVDRNVSISPDTGWGSDNATCPAPRMLTGANIEFSFDVICQGMAGIRPVVLAFAWLGAALILLGARSRS